MGEYRRPTFRPSLSLMRADVDTHRVRHSGWAICQEREDRQGDSITGYHRSVPEGNI
jgi:hypothetical protein